MYDIIQRINIGLNYIYKKEQIMAEFKTWYHRNETLASIRQRHSIRLFKDDPISDEDIITILKAANKAPSAHNQQSWRFIVIKGEKKREFGAFFNVEREISSVGTYPNIHGLRDLEFCLHLPPLNQ